ncbi:uncharacterized protein LOC130135909 [Syzygium oleosum]|uniref:uncharacterized protein LOC130135909 n=1 Tax=Syzygium oleosum TaxID=219896 RepID=UPI0024B92B0A|nr:uncharacterized protein LOC130135909 [Syzygium oleosum]
MEVPAPATTRRDAQEAPAEDATTNASTAPDTKEARRRRASHNAKAKYLLYCSLSITEYNKNCDQLSSEYEGVDEDMALFTRRFNGLMKKGGNFKETKSYKPRLPIGREEEGKYEMKKKALKAETWNESECEANDEEEANLCLMANLDHEQENEEVFDLTTEKLACKTVFDNMKKDYDLQEMEVKFSQVENDSLKEEISKISTKSSLGLEILKHILSIQIPLYNKCEEEDPEAEPKEAPEVEPEDEPEEEPEDAPEYEPEYDPEFVPEDESDEEPDEEERVEVPAESALEPSGAEHELEPEESQAGYDPMDMDLEVIPKEEPEDEDPEDKPEEAPEEEPEEEPEDVPEYEP